MRIKNETTQKNTMSYMQLVYGQNWDTNIQPADAGQIELDSMKAWENLDNAFVDDSDWQAARDSETVWATYHRIDGKLYAIGSASETTMSEGVLFMVEVEEWDAGDIFKQMEYEAEYPTNQAGGMGHLEMRKVEEFVVIDFVSYGCGYNAPHLTRQQWDSFVGKFAAIGLKLVDTGYERWYDQTCQEAEEYGEAIPDEYDFMKEYYGE